MYLLKGNYEHDDKSFHIDDPRVVVCDNNDEVMKFILDGEEIPCIHEPLFERNSKLGEYFMKTSNKFFLYGHIHEKGLVKRNGLNVGIDAHNYRPIGVDTVRFYKNAIQVHYDGCVFTEDIGFYVK
jgi:calcineurin-like phosphoesterase family protein